MTTTQNNSDRCKHLRELHTRIRGELDVLKESVRGEEREGVDNPVETVNIIKSLQHTLATIEAELQKCPQENQ
ncbi:MAG: hypothetical protein JO215_05275 [Ktedonobacteraceae bacterium]|nr:hypothetical protein [Ktedonobacteraceae bacterium]MBV9711527.1 hypothetical protein [Ktedonobacteraceae bacterium]